MIKAKFHSYLAAKQNKTEMYIYFSVPMIRKPNEQQTTITHSRNKSSFNLFIDKRSLKFVTKLN